jgi:hypothetical protein
MDLEELQEYFMNYVDGCRINVDNLPTTFAFENLVILNDNDEYGEEVTIITASGDVPDHWVNNAIMNLLIRYPNKVVTFGQTHDNDICFEFRNRDNEQV